MRATAPRGPVALRWMICSPKPSRRTTSSRVKILTKPGSGATGEIIGDAVGCTITKDEHARLAQHRNEDGWVRYKLAGMKVIKKARTTAKAKLELPIDQLVRKIDGFGFAGSRVHGRILYDQDSNHCHKDRRATRFRP
jgi:hypothetical protein